ncbi:MAG: hypothetical protein VR68_05170 [Peptococcaceae bacterium BRH_c4a]|nr:MAG: hypothetical protein VR68_05170 [Peptococcaceae bacterium BRH_c4a]
MFFRKITSRTKGKEYTYLKLIENYREGNKVKQRVIANLGNLESLTPEKVQVLISGLSRICGVSHSSTQLEAKKVLRYGEVLAIHSIWDTLRLTTAIEKAIENQMNDFNVPLLVELMTLDQMIKPPSKQAINDWYEFLGLPEMENNELYPHYFYNTLDTLAEAKYHIEGNIFKNITRLFPINTDFAFCRLSTCTFEPPSRPELQSTIYGKYILEEPDDIKKVDFGIVASSDGIPFGHWVFQSLQLDFRDMLKYLKNNYGIKKCIYIGDRNVTANTTLELLVAHGYEYIASRKLWYNQERDLLYREQIIRKKGFTELNERLWFKEVTSGDVRHLLCYDLQSAKHKGDLLEDQLRTVEHNFNNMQKTINERPHKSNKPAFNKNSPVFKNSYCIKYFEWYYNESTRQLYYQRKDDLIELEHQQAGMFLLETNSRLLSGKKILESYINTAQLGEPFRINNSFSALPSPFYVDTNISANIFICLLAAILEKTMSQLLNRAGINLHPRQALELLEEIKLFVYQLDDQEVKSITKIPKDQEAILRAIGVDTLQRTII